MMELLPASGNQVLAPTVCIAPMNDDSYVREESSGISSPSSHAAAAPAPLGARNDAADDNQGAASTVCVVPADGDTDVREENYGSSSCTPPGASTTQSSPSSDQQPAAVASAASDEALAAVTSDILLADLSLLPDRLTCVSPAAFASLFLFF